MDRFSKRQQTERVVEDATTVEDRWSKPEVAFEGFLEGTKRRSDRVVGLFKQIVFAKREHRHQRCSEEINRPEDSARYTY